MTGVQTCALPIFAVKEDGTVLSWGDNRYDQLGDGIKNDYIPVKVVELSRVINVDAESDSSFAVIDNGTVWSWGFNENGQLGDGTKNYKNSPAMIDGLTGVKSIIAGRFHATVLKHNGTVWAWGSNHCGQLGQLGDGTTYINKPVQVMCSKDRKSVV